MQALDKHYTEHRVFAELETYARFYKAFSMAVFGFCTMGTKAICNIDSYVYSSVQGTLESIRLTLQNGRINDAYALLRKYYDSSIINVYTNLYLQDNFSLETFIVTKINNWLHGKEQLPEFRIMSQYIRSSSKLKAINDILYADDRYKRVRDRCNDHAHYNFYQTILLNDGEVYVKDRLQWLDKLSGDLRDIFILHLGYIFYLNDHYMMSSDYIDSLEVGESPEENSQYWVAPFVQEIFDNIITKERPDITAAIKERTSMQLST